MTAVLFTCAGQRVDIVTAFCRAGAHTIALDVNPLAPALYHADVHELVPRIDDLAYVPTLAGLVRLHDVRLVVPLTDLDQTLLAERRDELDPALVLLPDPDVVRSMNDKYLAHLFFTADRPVTLAVIPAGYADGLDRRLENHGHVLIRGRRAKIVGAVSMDMLTADVTDIDGVGTGDEVVFLGEQGMQRIDAREMASWIGTIPYEILCRLGSRVERKYE